MELVTVTPSLVLGALAVGVAAREAAVDAAVRR